MSIDELRKEKAAVEVKLDLLKKRYEGLKYGDEEYESLKKPLISRLDEIESQIESETPETDQENIADQDNDQDDSLTDDEKDYASLKSAEGDISSKLMLDSVISFGVILAMGFIGVTLPSGVFSLLVTVPEIAKATGVPTKFGTVT